MKKILIILIIFLLNINMVNAKEIVKFSSCVDGDTFKVEINNEIKTVRMLAIDTPESVHPTKEVEYYGKEASTYTCNKLKNAKVIELEYDDNSDKTDKYNRILAFVFVDDYLLQDLLIENGYAEVAYLYGDYKYTSLLQDHESIAKSKNIGIWNDVAREKFNPNSDDELTKEDIILIIIIALLALIYPSSKEIKKLFKKYVK